MKKIIYFLFVWTLGLPLTALSQTLTFSASRGFYETPFQLTLSSSIAAGTIRYTTDGSAPTTTSGTVYSAAIPVKTTSVIRAIAYAGTTTTPVQTQTYLFLNDVIHQPKNIAGWPNHRYALGANDDSATHDYQMDPNVVNAAAYSSLIKGGLTSIPTMSLVLKKDDFWALYEGESTFSTSVEIIYPDQTSEQFDCGLESHSHNRLKRSLSLDIETGITTNLLKKAALNGETAANSFKNTKIVLRGGNNRSWARNWNPDRTCYTRDEWYRDSQLAISGIGLRGTFVHLYVNGLYWGLYNPVERVDGGMLSQYFGGKPADWLAMSHDGIRSGDSTRFTYLTTTLIKQDMTNAANYTQLKGYLDVAKFCDYLIVTWMTGMTDWPANNFHGANRNVPAGPFWYSGWDCEWSWDLTNGSNNGAWVHPQFRNDQTGSAVIAKIWHSARKNKEFMQLFADRVYKHCFNNGALTDAASRARWGLLNNAIQTAIIAESARWGDALEDGITRTRDTHWTPEVNRVDGLMNGNVTRFITALVGQGYYPALSTAAFNQEGNGVAAGFQLTITNPNATGVIYYTTDGTDPRNDGGGIAPTAKPYAGAISINGDLPVKARIKDGTTWSAIHEGTFSILKLYINEFLASNTKEADQPGEFDDWIELYNGGTQAVDIGGMYLTDKLSKPTQFQIPSTNAALTTIPAKGFLRLWADGQPAQGPLHLDIKLSNGGEQIGLAQTLNATTVIIDSLTFGAQTADVSMGRYPDGSVQFKSFTIPTPGKANQLGFQTGLYINEFLASNTKEADQPGEFDDWIEIYNSNSTAVNIGGLYLTDKLSNLTQFQIPTTNAALTTIPAKGFLRLWADGQPAQGPLHLDLKLSNGGEQIGLAQLLGADIGILDSLTFGAQTADVSVGRSPDGGKTFKQFFVPTPGSSNLIVFKSNLFINEFLVSNQSSITDELGQHDAWMEIYNNNAVATDIGGLYLSNNLSTPALWKIPSTSPAQTTIPAKGFLIVWADNQPAQGALHLGFTLPVGGGAISLADIVGSEVSSIDSTRYGSQTGNVSRGRYPDASVQFKSFTSPTPGASNTLPVLKNLYINEFMASNGANLADEFGEFDDWIEIYNGNTTAVDIGGLFITDQLSLPTQFQIPTTNAALTTIPAKGFLLLWADGQPSQGPLHVAIKLSAGGEQIGLIQQNGTTVNFLDSLTFAAQTLDVSDGRVQDGAASLVTFSQPTPKASNHPVAGQQVVSFTLVNADTDLDLQTLANGASLNLAALPTKNLNIRANTSPVTVGSVVFNLSGQQIRNFTEGGAPYSLFGDANGNYNVWVPAVGSYTLKCTPFSAVAGSGTAGTPLTINFTVTNQTGNNQAPVVSNAIPNQSATVGAAFNFAFAANTFTDPEGSALTYSASLSSNAALPAWLTFNATTRTFSGTPPSGSASPLTIKVTASDSQLQTSTTFSLTVNPAAVTPLYLINAGGPAVTTGGKNWSADQFFDMGTAHTNSTVGDVANTTDDVLYYSERYRVAFNYNIPVPAPGTYTVKLHFAEINFVGAKAGVGKRVFNVAVEGQAALTNFDINAQAGPGPAALIKTFTTQVNDGKLTLAFTSVVDNAKISAIEVYKVTNQAPVVSNAIPNQSATVGAAFNFAFAANTFTDPEGSALTYSASLSSNAALPAWLTFNATTRTFSGTPPSGSASPLTIKVTASDSQLQTNTTFSLTVNPAAVTPLYLINAGGPAVTTGGKNWSADQFFDMGTAHTNSTVGDVANTTDDVLYYSERYRVAFNYNIPVPAPGTYTVKLHFAEINFVGAKAGVGKRVFNVAVEGQAALTNFDINAQAGPGPAALIKTFTTQVNDGKLTLAFTSVVDNAKISAIEVYKVTNQAAARIASEELPVVNPLLLAYPNPLPDGRFKVSLSEQIQGTVSYVLVSQLGIILTNGQQTLNEPTSVLSFDFSHQMGMPGVYYLRLGGENVKGFIRLDRQ